MWFFSLCRFVLMIVSNKNNNNKKTTRHFQSLWFVFDDINLWLLCVYAFLTNLHCFIIMILINFASFFRCFSAHFMNCYFFSPRFLHFSMHNVCFLFTFYYSIRRRWFGRRRSLLSFSSGVFFLSIQARRKKNIVHQLNEINKKANDYRNTQFNSFFVHFSYISKRKRTHK